VFSDPKISLGIALTAVLWTAGLGLILADLWIQSARLGNLGLALCLVGAVLAARCLVFRATMHLEQRFTEAFDIGREVGQVEASRVPLQRIH
jgi:membrane-bound ClpP family serine protease